MPVEDCIRCGEEPGVDEQGYCGHCHWAVKVEIQAKGAPATAIDEVSSQVEAFIGVPFDPDADDRPWP